MSFLDKLVVIILIAVVARLLFDLVTEELRNYEEKLRGLVDEAWAIQEATKLIHAETYEALQAMFDETDSSRKDMQA